MRKTAFLKKQGSRGGRERKMDANPRELKRLGSGLLIFLLLMMFLPGAGVDWASAGVLYHPTEGMWDLWLFQNGEDYHLFFMSGGGIGGI